MATATTPRTKTKPAATAADRPVRPIPRRERRETVDQRTLDADKVLEQLEDGGRNAISAVRRFVDSVDQSLAGTEESPTRGHDIVDAALEMSDRMVEMGGDAIRGIVRSIGREADTTTK